MIVDWLNICGDSRVENLALTLDPHSRIGITATSSFFGNSGVVASFKIKGGDGAVVGFAWTSEDFMDNWAANTEYRCAAFLPGAYRFTFKFGSGEFSYGIVNPNDSILYRSAQIPPCKLNKIEMPADQWIILEIQNGRGALTFATYTEDYELIDRVSLGFLSITGVGTFLITAPMIDTIESDTPVFIKEYKRERVDWVGVPGYEDNNLGWLVPACREIPHCLAIRTDIGGASDQNFITRELDDSLIDLHFTREGDARVVHNQYPVKPFIEDDHTPEQHGDGFPRSFFALDGGAKIMTKQEYPLQWSVYDIWLDGYGWFKKPPYEFTIHMGDDYYLHLKFSELHKPPGPSGDWPGGETYVTMTFGGPDGIIKQWVADEENGFGGGQAASYGLVYWISPYHLESGGVHIAFEIVDCTLYIFLKYNWWHNDYICVKDVNFPSIGKIGISGDNVYISRFSWGCPYWIPPCHDGDLQPPDDDPDAPDPPDGPDGPDPPDNPPFVGCCSEAELASVTPELQIFNVGIDPDLAADPCLAVPSPNSPQGFPWPYEAFQGKVHTGRVRQKSFLGMFLEFDIKETNQCDQFCTAEPPMKCYVEITRVADQNSELGYMCKITAKIYSPGCESCLMYYENFIPPNQGCGGQFIYYWGEAHYVCGLDPWNSFIILTMRV